MFYHDSVTAHFQHILSHFTLQISYRELCQGAYGTQAQSQMRARGKIVG